MASERLNEVRARVHETVAEYGRYFTKIKYGHYRAVQGSAEIFVDVEEEVDEQVLIRIWAPVAYDAKLDQQTLLFLLQANDTRPVATFGVDDDMTVHVSQTLLGEYFHPEELHATVRAVALAADCLDDIIAKRVAGSRSADARPWLHARHK